MRARLLPVVLLLTCALTVLAQSLPPPVEMPGAWWRYHWNEVSQDEKPDAGDPVKVRLGGWQPCGRYLGAISGDVLSGDAAQPRRAEKILIALKTDAQCGGLIEVFLQDPGTDNDAGMRKRFELTTQYARFYVPLYDQHGVQMVGETGGGVPLFLRSASGEFEAWMQSDGNLVTYRVDPSGLIPTWSAWTGRLQ